ncbi:hypothetical protein RJG79_08465 [Mycoplasmatota bacterium WC44]
MNTLEEKIPDFSEIDSKMRDLGFKKIESKTRLIDFENRSNVHIILFCENLEHGEVCIAFLDHPEVNRRYFDIRYIIRGDKNFDEDEYLKKERCCVSDIENKLRFLFEHYDIILNYNYCRELYETNDYYKIS